MNIFKKIKEKKEIKKHDKSYVKKPFKIPEIPKLKKYSYYILYENGFEKTGTLETPDMDGVIDTFLRNQYSYGNLDNTKLVYFNSNKILEFTAEEISNKRKEE